VPTPALVLPIEFTLPLAAYREMGGHVDSAVALEAVLREGRWRSERWHDDNPWPITSGGAA